MKKVRDETCCLAPWVSLRIGLSGEVFACNHNSSFLLGKYPDQSLKEIWSGKRIHKLRKHLGKNDFSLGCDICAEDWRHQRNNAASFTLFRKYQPGPWPSMLDFRLSNRCNLQCIMCSGLSSSQFGGEMDQVEELFGADFIRQLDAFIPHLQTARFIGGEPFLIPEYYRIWERIIDLNPLCEIVVQTNATILNDKIKGLLEKGRFQISVSIDSFESQTYESIRRNASLTKVMENLDYFSDYAQARQADMVICFCPMRMNHHEIPDLMRYAEKRDAYICLNRFYYPAHLAIWSLPAEKIFFLRSDLSNYEGSGASEKSKINAGFLGDYIKLLGQWEDDARERVSIPFVPEKLTKLLARFNNSLSDDPVVAEKMAGIAAQVKPEQLYHYLNPIAAYYGNNLFQDFLKKTNSEIIVDDIRSIKMQAD